MVDASQGSEVVADSVAQRLEDLRIEKRILGTLVDSRLLRHSSYFGEAELVEGEVCSCVDVFQLRNCECCSSFV